MTARTPRTTSPGRRVERQVQVRRAERRYVSVCVWQVPERPVLPGAAARFQRRRLGNPPDVGAAAAAEGESHGRGDQRQRSQARHLRRDERLSPGRPVGPRHW